MHNRSQATLVVAREEFEREFQRPYTGDEADLNDLMGGIARGAITAYGDFSNGFGDERYANSTYDALRAYIQQSAPAVAIGDAIAIQATGERLSSLNFRDGQIDWNSLDPEGRLRSERTVNADSSGAENL